MPLPPETVRKEWTIRCRQMGTVLPEQGLVLGACDCSGPHWVSPVGLEGPPGHHNPTPSLLFSGCCSPPSLGQDSCPGPNPCLLCLCFRCPHISNGKRDRVESRQEAACIAGWRVDG